MSLTDKQTALLQYVMDWIAPPRTSLERKQQLATDWLNQHCPYWLSKGKGKGQGVKQAGETCNAN
ncbi:hypothetical protein LZP69_10510 [Shewanella sp. AS1]|uniref:hypothetical protein n=1 Tax=Shewanella sp. AS1 TaxID=2907626 RepID=UPI001F31716A|nr:hypothetical protein [Shewanella sp. AS1]MCE9679591.1 hypothetical protein [Shewanella sp. AS1]